MKIYKYFEQLSVADLAVYVKEVMEFENKERLLEGKVSELKDSQENYTLNNIRTEI